MPILRDETETRVVFPTSNLAQKMGARRLVYSTFSALKRLSYRDETTVPLPGMVLPVKDSAAGVVATDGQSAYQRFIE